MKIRYNRNLKEKARYLRNNSTHAEIKLWQCLKNKKLRNFDFHRQKPIDRFIADFFCNKLRLVIEVDGISHQLDEVKLNDDIKTRTFEAQGITVLRFTDEQIFEEIDNVISAIENYIDTLERHLP